MVAVEAVAEVVEVKAAERWWVAAGCWPSLLVPYRA